MIRKQRENATLIIVLAIYTVGIIGAYRIARYESTQIENAPQEISSDPTNDIIVQPLTDKEASELANRVFQINQE